MSEEQKNETQPLKNPVEIIKLYVDGVIMCSIRGLMAAIPSVPPQIILIEACRSCGKWAGSLFVGASQIDSFKYRKQCKDAFIEGMESAEMISADDKPKAKPRDADSKPSAA